MFEFVIYGLWTALAVWTGLRRGLRVQSWVTIVSLSIVGLGIGAALAPSSSPEGGMALAFAVLALIWLVAIFVVAMWATVGIRELIALTKSS